MESSTGGGKRRRKQGNSEHSTHTAGQHIFITAAMKGHQDVSEEPERTAQWPQVHSRVLSPPEPTGVIGKTWNSGGSKVSVPTPEEMDPDVPDHGILTRF